MTTNKAKIAINGFGRIGRAVLRILSKRDDLEVVAINDITPAETLTYLLKYDTVHGRFDGDVALEGDTLVAGRQRPKMLQVKDPVELPWKKHEVDLVIEATGRFRKSDEIGRHLDAGAGKVLLTVPAKDTIDYTCVLGVNDEGLRPDHRIVSNASCTTNCLAPVAKVLHEAFGIRKGYITTVHAYTNDQRLNDYVHKDLRRSRAAAENIIPTTTGAARAVGRVLPELEGRLDGIAMRVPVPDGSTVDLVVELDEDPSVEEINEAMRVASENVPLQGILEYSEEPLVSTDIIGNPFSAIFDAPSTRSRGARMAKVVAWYDNEWGYSCRVVDLAGRMAVMVPA
jgi:glyceraldehyde 3-phosphate dehydrogenase